MFDRVLNTLLEGTQRIVFEFESRFSMTQAFGCVHGNDLPISLPPQRFHNYLNCKQFFSLNEQVACNYRGRSIWPESMDNAKAFENFAVDKKRRNGKLPVICQSLTKNQFKVNSTSFGGPAYPSAPFCLKEYGYCKNVLNSSSII